MDDQRRTELEEHIRDILFEFDYDGPDDPSLKDTPRRYIAALEECLTPQHFEFTTFPANGYDQMVTVGAIRYYSLCEHHILPFFGWAHIAYIPDENIVGLSKIPRLVEYHSRGLNTQEYLTHSIANDLSDRLRPKGVGVLLTGIHLCQAMRGVKKESIMTTTCLLGFIRTEESARNEFLQSIKTKEIF